MIGSIPLWARKLLVDFIETGLGLVFALNLVFPTSIDDARQVAIIVGSAILSALVSAARRALPAFFAWVAEKLGTTESE